MNKTQIFGLYLGSEVKLKGPLELRGNTHKIDMHNNVTVLCTIKGGGLKQWVEAPIEDCQLYLRSMKDLTEEELMEYMNLQNCNLDEYVYCEIVWKLKKGIALSEDWFTEGIAIKL